MDNRNLPRLKLLLGVEETDRERDPLLSLLLDRAEETARALCRLPAEAAVDDGLILRMAAEDLNRLGSEGLSYKNYGNLMETYHSDYSDGVKALLRRYRRLAVI